MTDIYRIFRRAGLIGLLSLVAACASPGGGPGYATKTMPDKEYLQASESERQAYEAAVSDEAAAIERKKQVEYRAGRPVPFGDKKTGYTLMWDRMHNIAYIYPGHMTSHYGIEQEAMLAVATDNTGNILYQDTPGGAAPIRLLANVATQEGMGRVITKGLFQLGSSVLANVGSAGINALTSCDENCGTVNQAFAGANSLSKSGSSSTVNIQKQAAQQPAHGNVGW